MIALSLNIILVMRAAVLVLVLATAAEANKTATWLDKRAVRRRPPHSLSPPAPRTPRRCCTAGGADHGPGSLPMLPSGGLTSLRAPIRLPRVQKLIGDVYGNGDGGNFSLCLVACD